MFVFFKYDTNQLNIIMSHVLYIDGVIWNDTIKKKKRENIGYNRNIVIDTPLLSVFFL